MIENKRIKEIRKALKLTMEEFGSRLGVNRSTISRIESGGINVTEQMRRAICREFGINEAWLRDGIGEMRELIYGEEVAAFAAKYGFDDEDQAVIANYAQLTPEERKVIKKYIRQVFHTLERQKPETTTPIIPIAATDDTDIDAIVEDFRRQIEVEKKVGVKSEVSPSIASNIN